MMVQIMEMPFRRRGSLGNQIHSVKHIVDASGGSTSTQSVTEFAKTVNVPSASFDPIEIELGENINGFFISVFVIGSTGAPLSGPIDWYIIKTRTGQTVVPDPATTGISGLRSQIIHEEKGLSGSGDGTPMVFKGVIVIPKGMRRMRQGDSWKFVLISSSTDTNNFCFKAIYKSFS